MAGPPVPMVRLDSVRPLSRSVVHIGLMEVGQLGPTLRWAGSRASCREVSQFPEKGPSFLLVKSDYAKWAFKQVDLEVKLERLSGKIITNNQQAVWLAKILKATRQL